MIVLSVFLSLLLVFCEFTPNISFAQESVSVLYVPLIGITSVPNPLVLSQPDKVTYDYAVKNFLIEIPLTNVSVVDNKCSPVKFVEGDDDLDSQLDNNETWRYRCSTKVGVTTDSIATAVGTANNLSASQSAYSTVIVGSNNPPPLVSIVNTTKIADPFIPGDITFIYRVTNPGIVPLRSVEVSDDKCRDMSGKLGDTNGNNLLDTHEVWIYSCTMNISQTMRSTTRVVAYAGALRALSDVSFTVKVSPKPKYAPSSNTIFLVVGILSLLIFFYLMRRARHGKK